MRSIMKIAGIYLTLCSMISLIYSESCDSNKRCDDCFKKPQCIWCARENVLGECQEKKTSNCSKEVSYYPISNKNIIENANFAETVSFKPQRFSMELGVGQNETITTKYKSQENLKLDLYYLMDMSNSMKDDKEQLSKLGETLVNEISELTDKFSIGFGSFVDKSILPYDDPMAEKCKECRDAYSYINHLGLTSNTSEFTNQVKNSQISDNLDIPEGGLDAMMQAIVCKEKIGWRDNARHLLVYVSDGTFHYAGSGLLSGIYLPNDEKCHLDINNTYTKEHSLTMDYPSVGQINKVAKREDISVIFAVTEAVYPFYNKAKRIIKGSSAVVLSEDSSNIVEILKEQYQSILTTAELKVEEKLDHYDIKIKPWCLKDLSNGQKCINVAVGDEIQFDITVTMNKCPPQPLPKKETLTFKITGLGESISIDITPLCKCSCSDSPKEDDPLCYNNGDNICNACQCYSDYWGDHCNCSNENSGNNQMCKYENSDVICTGRGTCECGKCNCITIPGRDESYTGDLCECDDFSCGKNENGDLCSNNGNCHCGNCTCNEGWTGDKCGCFNSTEGCFEPGSTEICSGNGNCECNECKCTPKEDNINYYGKYCEDCDECPGKCDLYGDCAVCHVDNIKSKECEVACQSYKVSLVQNSADFLGKHCSKMLDECNYKFSYELKKDVHLYVLNSKECLIDPWVLGSIIFGSIVGGFLIILFIWKGYTTYADHKEMEAFEKRRRLEGQMTKNELYRDPNTEVQNPMFKKSNELKMPPME